MNKKSLTLLVIGFILFRYINSVSAQESTESADSVREKVKEKIQRVLSKPKAYLGTITDKTGETLQIKNTQGEIQFISVNPEKNSIVSVGKTSKSIKYDDVALGDFIITMGYVTAESESGIENGSSVLEAKRVLVTEEVKPTTRRIVFGSVTAIEKKVLTLKSVEEELEFEFPKKWKGPEIDEISENDRVVIVSYTDEGKTYIRTVEIINKNTQSSEN